MLKNLFKKQRQTVKQANMLVLSPVNSEKITSNVYRVGEFVPHARMRVIYEDANILYGTCYKKDETLYFVATDIEVIEHIRNLGAVPLVQNRYLRIFNEKKKMQVHVQKIQSNSISA